MLSQLLAAVAAMVSMAAFSSVSTNLVLVGAARFRPVSAGVVTIRPSRTADLEKIEKVISECGGRVHGRCGLRSAPSLQVEVNEATLKRLQEMKEVKGLSNPKPRRLFNDVAAGIVGVSNVWPSAGSAVHTLGLTGRNQYITTSDSGIDTGVMSTIHRDFTNNLVGFERVTYRSGKTMKTALSYDKVGHGTHTAGSIVGDGSSSGGAIRGMAYEAKLWAWFCADEDGLVWTPSYLEDLFRPSGLKDGTAYIHSASWGADDCTYNGTSQDIDEYCWGNPDFLPVFAAGNEGAPNTVCAEANAKNVLAVGATQSYRPDESYYYGDAYKAWYINSVSGFASQGPTFDGRVKPDVVAPGSWILSTRSTQAPDKGYWGLYDENAAYAFCGGTSMACPLTAGSVALVRQWLVEQKGFVKPSSALMKSIVMGGAAELCGTVDTNVTTPAPNGMEGWGRLNLAASLEPDGGRAVYLSDYIPFHEGSNVVFTLTTTNAAPLDIQLVWVDYPGEVYADMTRPVLVNDLDLVVRKAGAADGTFWFGNGGTMPDALNNAESVRIADAERTTYTITVKGRKIPHPSEEGGAAALYVRGAFDPKTVHMATSFATYYKVRITSSSPGDCYAEPELGYYSYQEGTEVTVTADPYSMVFGQYGNASTRYPFIGFSGTGDVPASGSSTCVTFTVTQDSSIDWRWDAARPDYRFRVFVALYGYAERAQYSFWTRSYTPYYDRYENPYQVEDRWVASNEMFTVQLPADCSDDPLSISGCHSADGWKTCSNGTWTYRYTQGIYFQTDADVGDYLNWINGEPWPAVEITMDEGCDLLLEYFESKDIFQNAGIPTWAPSWWILKYMSVHDASVAFDDTAGGDQDGDGLSNLEEYRIDTDPLDPLSHLAITGFAPTNVSWIAGREVPQVLETADSLKSGLWKPVFTNVTGSVEMQYPISPSSGNGFYRISVPQSWQR